MDTVPAIRDLAGKRVTVLGVGLNGGGADTIRFLVAHGASVVATDLKTRQQLAPTLAALKGVQGVTYILGQHRIEDFTSVDMVIKSPGVPWTHRHVRLAREHGIPVFVDAALFMTWCRRPVIGITGSKGKTTTTQMILHLLTAAGRTALPVGSGQVPVLGQLAAVGKDAIPVFEMSSWRLAGTRRVERSPHIAVVTNLLTDHADYYRTRAAYEADKFAITRFQKPSDVLVLNADDPVIAAWAGQTQARTVRYSLKNIVGDGVFVRRGVVCERVGDTVTDLFPVDALAVAGRHNLANMCAAVAAVRAVGVPDSVVARGVATFRGVAHRCHVVAEQDGILYIDDTAATIPDAAIATIQAQTRPVVLIAGGADKNLEFGPFAATIAAEVKDVVFLKGAATDKILARLTRLAPGRAYLVVDSMPAAVVAARERAVAGDAVILSPGAASFGLFANEFDRGDQFIAAVSGRH